MNWEQLTNSNPAPLFVKNFLNHKGTATNNYAFLEMNNQLIKSGAGFTLVELLVAMTVFTLVISGVVFLILDAQSANRQGRERTKAALIAQESIEALRSIRNQGWKFVRPGTFGLSDQSGIWALAGTNDSVDQFTRNVQVEYAHRDVSGNLVPSGGTIDFDTKKITTNVQWDFTPLRPSTITFETYLTNWRSLHWRQTTQADFSQGTHTNTQATNDAGGEIQLTGSSQGQNFSSTFNNAADYTFDGNVIEVTAGQARLKQLTSLVSGDTLNAGFDTGTTSWTYNDWDQGAGEVDVTGSRVATNGNPGGWINVSFPVGKQDELGGYWQQNFTTSVANPTATLTLDWRSLTFTGSPISLYLYAFVDSASGAPSIPTNVWSQHITNTASWTGPVTINVSSKVATVGTYYLKLAAWLETGNTNVGPFTVGYDNAKLHWEKQVPGGYDTNKPTIVPTTSFTGPITSWQSFAETATKNGGEIYYQLSNDDGATWRYWSGTSWAAAATAGNYNTASVVNTNFTSFPATNQKIRVKAFFASNGSQQVILDEVRITGLGTTAFAASGSYESAAFDTGSSMALFNYIAWNATVPVGTTLRWQLRTSATQAGLSTATWVGPDGTSASSYANPGEIIQTDPGATGSKWIQYKLFFTSDGTATPTVQEVTINYEP